MDLQLGAKVKVPICGVIKFAIVTEISPDGHCTVTFRKNHGKGYDVGWALNRAKAEGNPRIPSWVTFNESNICGSWAINTDEIIEIWT